MREHCEAARSVGVVFMWDFSLMIYSVNRLLWYVLEYGCAVVGWYSPSWSDTFFNLNSVIQDGCVQDPQQTTWLLRRQWSPSSRISYRSLHFQEILLIMTEHKDGLLLFGSSVFSNFYTFVYDKRDSRFYVSIGFFWGYPLVVFLWRKFTRPTCAFVLRWFIRPIRAFLWRMVF